MLPRKQNKPTFVLKTFWSCSTPHCNSQELSLKLYTCLVDRGRYVHWNITCIQYYAQLDLYYNRQNILALFGFVLWKKINLQYLLSYFCSDLGSVVVVLQPLWPKCILSPSVPPPADLSRSGQSLWYVHDSLAGRTWHVFHLRCRPYSFKTKPICSKYGVFLVSSQPPVFNTSYLLDP